MLAGWQAAAVLQRAARTPGRVASGQLEPGALSGRLSLMARAATGRW